MKAEDLFQDNLNAKCFETYGYCLIDLLDSDALSNLESYYHNSEFGKKRKEGFSISLDESNVSEIKNAQETILANVLPKLDGVLNDYKAFTASYVVKEPGKKNIVPPHQDWSFVDEAENFSCTVWIPLLDVDMFNGGLGVIKGSHRLFKHYRSSPSPQSQSPFADHIFTLFPFVEIIEVKAGQALVFDNRLLHASPPNISDKTRIGVGIGVTSKDAPLRHYFQIPNKTPELISEYEVDSSFFLNYNNKQLSEIYDDGGQPKGLKLLRTFERNAPTFKDDELKAIVNALPGIKENKKLNAHLAELFDYNNKKMDKPEVKKTEKIKEENSNNEQVQQVWKDDRTFFQKYTIKNIFAEIIWRLKGRPDQSSK